MPKFIIRPDSSNTYVIRYQSSGFQTIHGRSPYPNTETGTWFYFDDSKDKYVDSGFPYMYDDTKIEERLKKLEERSGDYLLPEDIASNDEFLQCLGIPKIQDGGEQVDG